jgi:hypothetical protein
VTILPTIRYRLTIVIDTPDGRRTGSAVMELTSHINPEFPGPEAGGFHFMVNGEAVPVLLANGNYVFVVQKWRDHNDALAMLRASFSDILPPVHQNSYGDERIDAIKRQMREFAGIRGSRPVPSEYYPIVAFFPDISNPETIVAADAGRVEELIADSRLVSMSVEVTQDPVTRKIKRILPWLESYQKGYFDPIGRRDAGITLPTERRLSNADFYTG